MFDTCNPSTQDPEGQVLSDFQASQQKKKKIVNTNKDTIGGVPPSGQKRVTGKWQIPSVLAGEDYWLSTGSYQSLKPKQSRAGGTDKPASLLLPTFWSLHQQQQAVEWSWTWPNWTLLLLIKKKIGFKYWICSQGVKSRISRVPNRRLLADHNKVRKWQGGTYQIQILYIPSKGWIW